MGGESPACRSPLTGRAGAEPVPAVIVLPSHDAGAPQHGEGHADVVGDDFEACQPAKASVHLRRASEASRALGHALDDPSRRVHEQAHTGIFLPMRCRHQIGAQRFHPASIQARPGSMADHRRDDADGRRAESHCPARSPHVVEGIDARPDLRDAGNGRPRATMLTPQARRSAAECPVRGCSPRPAPSVAQRCEPARRDRAHPWRNRWFLVVWIPTSSCHCMHRSGDVRCLFGGDALASGLSRWRAAYAPLRPRRGGPMARAASMLSVASSRSTERDSARARAASACRRWDWPRTGAGCPLRQGLASPAWRRGHARRARSAAGDLGHAVRLRMGIFDARLGGDARHLSRLRSRTRSTTSPGVATSRSTTCRSSPASQPQHAPALSPFTAVLPRRRR